MISLLQKWTTYGKTIAQAKKYGITIAKAVKLWSNYC